VFLLAQKTGWSVEYILWEIPLAILNQGFHVFLQELGLKLKRTSRASDSDFVDIAKKLNI
jgi:hypothetical protein